MLSPEELVRAARELAAEELRRRERSAIEADIVSADPGAERERLEAKYGQVWDSDQLGADFEVEGFVAPFVVARRRADGVRGSLRFQHAPRFYFSWEPA